MHQTFTLQKILIINVLLAALHFALPANISNALVTMFYCIASTSAFFILCSLAGNASFAYKHKKMPLFIIVTAGSIILTITAIKFDISALYFLCCNFLWTTSVLLSRKAANVTARILYRKLNKHMKVAVIGYTQTTTQFAEQLKKKVKYSFEGFFDNYEPGISLIKQPEYLGSIESCLEIAKQKKVTDLYISSSLQSGDKFEVFAQKAEKYGIRVNLIDTGERLDTELYKSYRISGIPILQRYNEPLRRLRNKLIKRSFDLIISGFALIFIVSWLTPLIGLLIKLESKGPIFFKQPRSGRDNTSFHCYKFRSMKKNRESDVKQAAKNDQRITRLGAFLRRTSIDELPQFINVFKGDMSLVGPRPHMLVHTEEYSKQVNNYMMRLYIKPGITGWAQAKGYRGEITGIHLMSKRVEHDIWYLENWSFWLDIRIIFITAFNIVKGDKNAF